MIGLYDILEDFGTTQTGPISGDSIEVIESRRLDAFEEGYKAGWDDAVSAHDQSKKKLSLELTQNLMDLSFTYNEAYAQLTKSLRPLFTEIVGKLLPEIMRKTIGLRVSEELQRLASGVLNGEATILVAPENYDNVSAILEMQHDAPTSIKEDDSLNDGQVQLALADEEVEIDLANVITEMSALIDAYHHDLNEGPTHDRQQAI